MDLNSTPQSCAPVLDQNGIGDATYSTVVHFAPDLPTLATRLEVVEGLLAAEHPRVRARRGRSRHPPVALGGGSVMVGHAARMDSDEHPWLATTLRWRDAMWVETVAALHWPPPAIGRACLLACCASGEHGCVVSRGASSLTTSLRAKSRSDSFWGCGARPTHRTLGLEEETQTRRCHRCVSRSEPLQVSSARIFGDTTYEVGLLRVAIGSMRGRLGVDPGLKLCWLRCRPGLGVLEG